MTFDFWNLTFNQCTIGPMVQWSNGPMDLWTNGPMDQWTNGPMVQWPNGQMDQWTNGPMDQGTILWWQKCDGNDAMAIGWWQAWDGNCVMAIMWWQEQDGNSVLAMVWWQCCDGNGMMAIVWWQEQGGIWYDGNDTMAMVRCHCLCERWAISLSCSSSLLLCCSTNLPTLRCWHNNDHCTWVDKKVRKGFHLSWQRSEKEQVW